MYMYMTTPTSVLGNSARLAVAQITPTAVPIFVRSDMAEGEDDTITVLGKLGEEYLNCSICHDRYKQPKILNCLHSFCEECLLKYQPSQGPVKLSCPVCRQETDIFQGGVAGLKANFHLSGMVEAFQSQEKRLAGGRSSPTVGECIQAPPVQRTVRDCRKHPGERTWFYCQSCRELVCRVCTAKTHREHEFQEIDAAAVACRESIRGYFPRLEDHLATVECELGAINTNSQLTASAAEKSREEVTERALAAMALVMDAKQRILDQINATERERVKTAKDKNKNLVAMRERLRHSLTVSERLARDAKDEDLLSLYTIIQGDLKDLSEQPDIPPPEQHPLMTLLPATRQTVVDLGRLVVETERWEMRKRVGKRGSDKEDFDGARGITVCSDGGIAVADLGLWTRGITLFAADWTYKDSIKFSENPRDVASVKDCIVVADNTSKVKVYDSQRMLAFQFPTTPPDAVAQTPVNIVSVASTGSGTIVVGDVKRNVITEHRPADGALLRTIPTNVPPYFLGVHHETGRILLSGLDTGDIEEIDADGSTVFTVSPIIAGELKVSCRGVCYKKDGNFYAVVHGKESTIGHVHQYSSTGVFIGCVARDLYDPNGIALTAQDELAVADCFSVKVFEKV